MSKQTNKTAKETKVSNKKENKVETKTVTTLNLKSFADQLKNVDVKEKQKKETIYIYPEGFSEKDINSEKGKKHRNSLRNKLKRHCNNVLVYSKQLSVSPSEEIETKLKNEIGQFKAFYKENYKLNDFTIESLSHSKKDDQIEDLKLFIQIIQFSELNLVSTK